jgi:hypothetical protein
MRWEIYIFISRGIIHLYFDTGVALVIFLVIDAVIIGTITTPPPIHPRRRWSEICILIVRGIMYFDFDAAALVIFVVIDPVVIGTITNAPPIHPWWRWWELYIFIGRGMIDSGGHGGLCDLTSRLSARGGRDEDYQEGY